MNNKCASNSLYKEINEYLWPKQIVWTLEPIKDS